jgi:hypothetical protein
MKGTIKVITYKEAIDFLLPKHYSGRKPVISKAFGWVIDDEVVAVCTFGKPASNSLCKGIAGDEHTKSVYELNRLCRIDSLEEPLSSFVGKCLRELKKENWIVVSYADSGMNHNGYIYQACNFMYTGATVRRTDKYTEGNKHSRHYKNTEQGTLRKVRSSKHRYVFFCTGNKRLKKKWYKDMNYEIQEYPKNENKNYVLGEYQKPEIIDTSKKKKEEDK